MNILETPMEAFTQDTLDESYEREADIMASIGKVDVEIEALQARQLDIKKRFDSIASLKKEISLLRGERATLAGQEKDHSSITEQIVNLQEQLTNMNGQLDIWEDEKKGVANLVGGLQSNRLALEEKLAVQKEETRIIRYCLTANEYNAQAEKLASVVESLWMYKKNLPKPYNQIDGGPLPCPKRIWYHNALSKIPVLRMNWTDGEDQPEFFFSR